MLKRKKEIMVWLTEEEYDALKTSVAKTGLSMQAYLRSIIFSVQLKEQPSVDFLKVLKVMRQISSSLNQLAVQANELGYIDTVEYWRNVEMLQDEVGRLIREAYG